MFELIIDWLMVAAVICLAAWALYDTRKIRDLEDTIEDLHADLEDALDDQAILEGRLKVATGQLAEAVNDHIATGLYIDFLLFDRQTVRMELEATKAERDELQADIDLVAERRAKWRLRAERVEAWLPVAQKAFDTQAELIKDQDAQLDAYKEILESVLDIADNQDQAIAEFMAEREVLKGHKADLIKIIDASAADLISCRNALAFIERSVQDPVTALANAETLGTDLDFGTDANKVIHLVLEGLRDFVNLVHERTQMMEAAQADRTRPVPQPANAEPFDRIAALDLPF